MGPNKKNSLSFPQYSLPMSPLFQTITLNTLAALDKMARAIEASCAR